MTVINKSVDVGTNTLISAVMDEQEQPVFKIQRDAYFRITPKSAVNSKSIKLSLDRRNASYIIDEDGSYIVVGNDALDMAIERGGVTERPLSEGVISAKSKASLPIIKLLLKNILGEGSAGSKLVYSIPALPIDQNFDVLYHDKILGMFFKELGYDASSINEAFAVGLSELLDEGLTGICVSFGSGMQNICVMHEGDSLLNFALTRSGDWIDNSVGRALDLSPSIILQEKEAGTDLYNPRDEISNAINVYFNGVIKYSVENIMNELNKRKKELPRFKDPVPLIVSGGLTLASGFVRKFNETLEGLDFPIKISEVIRAKDPMTAVAHGCLLAAYL